MNKIKEAIAEVFIIFVVGGLIGVSLAVVSNLFVIGVQWFGQQRLSSDMFNVTLGSHEVSFSSLICLWLAAGAVIAIKKTFGIAK